jgi:hypothetical protein
MTATLTKCRVGTSLLLLVFQVWGLHSEAAESSRGAETSFSAEGTMLRNQPMGKLEYSFKVSVSGRAWEILLIPGKYELDPRESEGVVIPDYIHGASDGKEFRVVMGFTNAAVKTANRAIASRGPGAVPFQVSPELMELWYVFASHLYLSSRDTNKWIVPIENSASDSRAQIQRGFPGLWRSFDTPPGLPEEICFLGQELDSGTAHGPTLTNVHMRVLQSTNIGGYQLPLSIKTHYYFPLGTNVIVRAQSQITGSRFSLNAKVGGFPVLPGISAISDFRFATNPSSRAFAGLTNAWPSDAMAGSIASPMKSER